MNVNINQKAIKQVSSLKYLWVTIDWSLSWKKHVHQVSKNIQIGIGLLLKLRHFVDVRIRINIYYSIIYPFFTCGVMSSYVSNVRPLVILQKKATRNNYVF